MHTQINRAYKIRILIYSPVCIKFWFNLMVTLPGCWFHTLSLFLSSLSFYLYFSLSLISLFLSLSLSSLSLVSLCISLPLSLSLSVSMSLSLSLLCLSSQHIFRAGSGGTLSWMRDGGEVWSPSYPLPCSAGSSMSERPCVCKQHSELPNSLHAWETVRVWGRVSQVGGKLQIWNKICAAPTPPQDIKMLEPSRFDGWSLENAIRLFIIREPHNFSIGMQ